jgi:hypothetical protein
LQGVLLILAWAGISAPAWLSAILSGGDDVMALLGPNSFVTLVLGVWCFIAGIGLFQEQEWAWGQALVVLSIICVNAIGSIVGWITGGGFDPASLLTWIALIGGVLAIVLFVYLLVTKKRYA